MHLDRFKEDGLLLLRYGPSRHARAHGLAQNQVLQGTLPPSKTRWTFSKVIFTPMGNGRLHYKKAPYSNWRRLFPWPIDEFLSYRDLLLARHCRTPASLRALMPGRKSSISSMIMPSTNCLNLIL